MSLPKYAERFGRLPEVFELLAAHPDGVALTRLADEVGVAVGELREDLLAFFAAEVTDETGYFLSRPPVLEFFGADWDDDIDPNEAEYVRLGEGAEELGVQYVDAAELAVIDTAARALLEIEPDNADLADSLAALTETLYGERELPEADPAWNRHLPVLRQAVEEGRAVRIVYSRAWIPGVRERVIHPYRLIQTRRGWEVDAGPPADDESLRTYLLSNIRETALTEESFRPPARVGIMLVEQRRTKTVRVRLPQSARWVGDFYAERVRVIEDDETAVVLDLDLLPPLDRRVGTLLCAAGPAAAVLQPPALAAAGAEMAVELARHFGG